MISTPGSEPSADLGAHVRHEFRTPGSQPERTPHRPKIVEAESPRRPALTAVVRSQAVKLLRKLAPIWQVVALVAAYVVGWTLVTWGLARLLVFEVWLLSGGLFLLSLGGLGLLKDVAVEGLYVLGTARRRR